MKKLRDRNVQGREIDHTVLAHMLRDKPKPHRVVKQTTTIETPEAQHQRSVLDQAQEYAQSGLKATIDFLNSVRDDESGKITMKERIQASVELVRISFGVYSKGSGGKTTITEEQSYESHFLNHLRSQGDVSAQIADATPAKQLPSS